MAKHTRNIDLHLSKEVRTPMKPSGSELSDEEKIALIEKDIHHIMDVLGLDLNDNSLKGTPLRVAKMYVHEIFYGLKPEKLPVGSTFENKYKYNDMLVETNINVYSTCEHHLLPIIGKAHVGYISKGNVIGLSKMNRIVEYYCKRPQVQERLTIQIVEELQHVLGSEDVACVIDAKHLCVNSRGVNHINSSTITGEYQGKFKDDAQKRLFLSYLNLNTEF